MKISRLMTISMLFFIFTSTFSSIIIIKNEINSTPIHTPAISADDEYNLNDSFGLVIKQNDFSVFNLKKIASNGSILDTCIMGSASVSGFFISPQNKTYLYFSSPISINGSQYILAELSHESNSLIGIEGYLNSIKWNWGQWAPDDPIQFDAEGAIYYVGTSPSGNIVIRRNLNGTITDLFNQSNTDISHFVVMDDGDVYFSGSTNSEFYWLKKVSPIGQITYIYGNINVWWLRKFPNNKVYLSIWGGGSNYGGVYYIKDDDTLDPRQWIAGSNCNNIQYYPYNVLERVLNDSSGFWLCDAYDLINLENGSVIGLTWQNGLVQYYPKAIAINPSLISLEKIASAFGNNIFISGVDQTMINKVILYNLDTKTETVIFSQYEVFQMNLHISPTYRYLITYGLDFTDNQMKIGIYNLNTTYTLKIPVGFNDQLISLQSFNNKYQPYCNIGIVDYSHLQTSTTSSTSTSTSSQNTSGSNSSNDPYAPNNYDPTTITNPFNAIGGSPLFYIIFIGVAMSWILIRKTFAKSNIK